MTCDLKDQIVLAINLGDSNDEMRCLLMSTSVTVNTHTHAQTHSHVLAVPKPLCPAHALGGAL